MIRIGQLTDIHVRGWSDLRPRDFFGKRATGVANYMAKRRHEYRPEVLATAVQRLVAEAPDMVVVTGDLSNIGLESELRAASAMLQPLVEAGIRVQVIPGNHDAYTRDSIDGRFERVFAEQVRGERLTEDPWPYVARAGHVSVLCVNSAVPTAPIQAWGRVGTAQLERARDLARRERDADRELVVAVHHHPHRPMHRKRDHHRNLRDAAALRGLVREFSVRLLLHGHNHYFEARRAEDAVFFGLSSSISSRHGDPHRAGQVAIHELAPGRATAHLVADWNGSDFGAWKRYDAADLRLEEPREIPT